MAFSREPAVGKDRRAVLRVKLNDLARPQSTRQPKGDNASGRCSDDQIETGCDITELEVFFQPGENCGGIKPLDSAPIQGKYLESLM